MLLTGGAGFIGSHVVDVLLERGADVVVVDDLSSGSIHKLDARVRLHVTDITGESLQKLFEVARPSLVVHFAAQVSVVDSVTAPLHDAKINILGGLNVLECCRRYGVQKVVFASSAAVYGEPKYLGVDESHTTNPLSPYGASKLSFEHYLDVYAHLYRLPYASLRFSNVYGPRQDVSGEGGVVAAFIDRILNGLCPVIFGDGSQTRDFVFVKDVAHATIAALTSGLGQYNVSTGIETSIVELAEMLCDISGVGKVPEFGPARAGDIQRSYLCANKAAACLHWRAQTPLRRGLQETFEYYQRSMASHKPDALGGA